MFAQCQVESNGLSRCEKCGFLDVFAATQLKNKRQFWIHQRILYYGSEWFSPISVVSYKFMPSRKSRLDFSIYHYEFDTNSSMDCYSLLTPIRSQYYTSYLWCLPRSDATHSHSCDTTFNSSLKCDLIILRTGELCLVLAKRQCQRRRGALLVQW